MKRLPIPSFRFLTLAAAFAGLAVAGRAQTILPDPTAGQPYSFQLTTNPPQPAGSSYSADGLPAGLSIGSSSGTVSGTTTTVGLFKGTVHILYGSATNIYPYQITVDPQVGAPAITSNGSAFGTVGTPFLYTIEATNGPTSYNYAQLPPGLASSGAQISGTPTTAGLFFTSVSANNGSGQGGILVLFFTISAAGPLPSLTSPALVSSPESAAFSYTITATNSPTSFAATGLPAGLSLDTSSGVISGTPDAPQVASISLTAANSYGSSLPRNLILTIGDFSSITSAQSATGVAGSSFAYTLTADNNPVTYNLAGSPSGLTFNATSGSLTGTPTTPGSYTLTASANNALGTGPSTTLVFTVTDPASGASAPIAPLILVEPSPQSAAVGTTAQFSVTAVGSGALGYQWSLNSIPISGATGPMLALGEVDSSDSGTYTVLVSNSVGEAVSAPAYLTILSLFVPPAITAQPYYLSSATVGSPVSFTVGAAGIAPLSYQWLKDGVPVAGATAETLTLLHVQAADAGTYSAVVTNPAGSAASTGSVLKVYAEAYAPIFQYQPSATEVTAGGTATLIVGVVGSPPISYQWYEAGLAVPGATTSSLTFVNASAGDSGSYSVVITDAAGHVTSADAVLTVNPVGGPPVPVSIVLQPAPVSATVGSVSTFTAAVTGDGPITYQWRKNQAAIAGATSPSFTIVNVQVSDAGTYDVVASNPFSADVSYPTPMVVLPAGAPGYLTNVSVRGFSGTAAQALAIGLVVRGTGTETALVRAVGPTLSDFGLTGFLADPQLAIFDSSQEVVASNDNWGGATALSAAFAQAGAFGLPPGSLDAALIESFQPGAYTAQVSGANGGTGIVLLEAYDIDAPGASTAQFVNVSARGLAGSGSQVLTVGFVVGGASSKTVLIRGIGPGLGPFSVAGALAQPQLTVFDSGQNVLGFNEGWGGTAELRAVFDAVGAFAIPPTSADSAVLVSLPPGSYTAEVSGADGSTGIALLEVYVMP
ncbi:MAG TPA: immunoglobulin domain-containing protein [Opitutaceae bacterium]